MKRVLVAAALVTSCAAPATVTVEAAPHVIDDVRVQRSIPIPTATVVAPRPTPSKASRSRSLTGTPRAGRTLNWSALADCESSGNPRAVSASGKYRGLYQFDLRTWRSVGGTGDPIDATPSEQTHRAALLYAARGRSPWPHCGRLL